MDVTIDGEVYVSKNSTNAHRIGVAITTHNRPDILAKALAAHLEYAPPGATLVVVDDGSNPPAELPAGVIRLRYDEAQGIPAAKNASITALYDAGCEHLFLLDDDTYPQATDWWRPYVESAEPHLQYSWTHFAKDTKPVPKMEVLYADDHLVGYTWSMGCLLYVERRVIDAVGGMDLRFTPGMEEHCEWSQRIHNAGLTTFVHQDVDHGGQPKIYAADEHYGVSRGFTPQDRLALCERNTALRLSLADSAAYVEFRPPRDVVLTSYFTGGEDLQRKGTVWPDGLDLVMPLQKSVAEYGHELVILHNTAAVFPGTISMGKGGATHTAQVGCVLSPYTQRWLSQYQWLRAHPEVRYAWCVDATDVTMLRDPFPVMSPGLLYCGWEPTILATEWILKHCPPSLQDWVTEHASATLLNTGVVGAERRTLMTLCRLMTDHWVEHRGEPLAEMIYFNHIVRTHFPDAISGPIVTTVFKSDTPNGWSFFQHK